MLYLPGDTVEVVDETVLTLHYDHFNIRALGALYGLNKSMPINDLRESVERLMLIPNGRKWSNYSDYGARAVSFPVSSGLVLSIEGIHIHNKTPKYYAPTDPDKHVHHTGDEDCVRNVFGTHHVVLKVIKTTSQYPKLRNLKMMVDITTFNSLPLLVVSRVFQGWKPTIKATI